jgi:hypothetical protein
LGAATGEGVLWHQASATDLLFITLPKSEALFSPSTRYRDLALGPSLLNSESQSTTTVASSTGQRYIHHATPGSRVLLFVREQRKQDGRAGGPLRACSLFLATGSPAGPDQLQLAERSASKAAAHPGNGSR